MIIRKSKVLQDVYYSRRNAAQDMKGTRLLSYSWTTFLGVSITDVYETIYRKEIHQAQEFHGLFYYPKQSFLFRCFRGKAQLLAADLRSNSVSFLKCEKVSLTSDGENQTYLPIGFAWGILSEEKNTAIQIHTTKSNGSEIVMVDPFGGQFDFDWGSEEFSVAKYNLPLKKIEDFGEHCSE